MAWPVIAGVAAVAGGIASAVGGHQQAQAAQNAANDRADSAEEMWEWNWEETKRQESYAQYEVDIARINNQTVANFTDQIALDKYNRELYIRDYNYRNEVNAYNKSEQQYAQQIDYNAISATLARDEQALWFDEQLKQAGFDREGLILDTDKKLEDIGYDYTEIANMLGEQRDLFASQRQTLNLKQQFTRAKTSFDIQTNQIKGLQGEGKARAMGQAGRTGRKNRQAALATAGLTQAALVDAITRADSAFDVQRLQNLQKYGYQRLAYDVKEDRLGTLANFTKDMSELGHRKIEATRESAYNRNKINLLKIEHDQYGADMSAENRRLSPPPSYQDLPPIPAPYKTPEVYIPDAYRTGEKPPGPVGAPNMMAGAGLMAAGQIMSSISSAAAAYEPSTPNYSGGGRYEGGDYSPTPTTPPPVT